MFSAKKIFSVIGVCALFLVACSPEDGETGPAGPIGPEGQIGPKGDPGADGEDGTDGVANISTSTFFVASTDWTDGGVETDTLDVPEITQEVVDNGTVQVFQTEDASNPQWGDLPYSFVINLNTPNGVIASQITIQAEHVVGKIYLTFINDLNGNITTSWYCQRASVQPINSGRSRK